MDMIACTKLLLVAALAVFVAPAAAANGACSDIRCFNTVPEVCCPAKYLNAGALGAKMEQVVSPPHPPSKGLESNSRGRTTHRERAFDLLNHPPEGCRSVCLPSGSSSEEQSVPVARDDEGATTSISRR